MIKTFTHFLILCFLILAFTLNAQENNSDRGEAYSYSYEGNSAINPCISQQQYEAIERRCNQNIRLLNNGRMQRFNAFTTPLSWPLRAGAGMTDYSFYFIAAYVDQNTAATAISDWNCGTNTYDGHHGTDIAIFPYGFYKMDNDQVEVIAAAPGTIIDKSDGNFDRNCGFNNLTANYVVIQHADGSYALYWHMKKNSITAKAIGQSVVNGEYLGVVGSSGSASGPHLHFEVWSGSTNTTYKDPFSGTCNSLNNYSWWASQKSYTEPAVIKVSANTTDVVLPGCPNTETPNESNSFTIPFQGPGLPPGYAKFYMFLRNETTGMSADCKILNPNGSTFNSWTYNSTADSKTKIYGWSKLLPANPGTYTFKVTYNSVVSTFVFDVNTSTGIPVLETHANFSVYPNPSSGKINIEYDSEKISVTQLKNYTIEFYNVLGKIVYQSHIADSKNGINLNVHDGVYFYRVKNEGGVLSSGKIVIE